MVRPVLPSPSPLVIVHLAAWLIVSGLTTALGGTPLPNAPSGQARTASLGQGVTLSRAPSALPGAVPEGRDLAQLAAYMVADDRDGALVLAEQLSHSLRDRRERAAAAMVLGMLHREAGRANLASEAFTQVRASGGPLAAWGAWFEAEQDLARGRQSVAIGECQRYLSSWPEGHHAEDCEQLIAFAHAQLGHVRAAEKAATEWDDAHGNEPISEQVQIALADWEIRHDPDAAIRRLGRLTVWFEAPLTIRIAQQGLAYLRAQGHPNATEPDDLASRMSRAVSLRDSASKPEAWRQFQALASESADNPTLASWVKSEATTFGWRTHQWDFIAGIYAERAEEEPDEPQHAWMLYRSLDRGGRYAEAATVARDGLQRFAGQRPWRNEEERIGRTMLLARAYPDARALFDSLSDKRGWTGLRNAYYAGFASVMAGDVDDADSRLTKLIDDDAGLVTEARYWRAKVLNEISPDRADADRRWIQEQDPRSWYALWLHTPEHATRAGRWSKPHRAPVALDTPTPAGIAAVPMARVAQPAPQAAADGFSRATWPLAPSGLTSPLTAPPAPTPVVHRADYPPNLFYAPDAAQTAFDDFVRTYHKDFPELLTVQDLARVGLHDLSGPLFAQVYDDWTDRVKKRDTVARTINSKLGKADWRNLFITARDHHHATRFTYGLDKHAPPEAERDVLTLSLPKAHAHDVWTFSQRHDVDPYLVLGLMRTESLYNANAVSRVGARGPMQIMPRTGHLLADRVDDVDFQVGKLHDPSIAIGYGIRYLGLLIDRFDGVFPLAVAAYNGGPHNVSAWMKGAGDLPLDAFIEHMPYSETRRYVRSVTERYATYADLYADDEIVLPARPLGDHPDIVDF